jgi:DNA polymerase-3 subunit gamma/tau
VATKLPEKISDNAPKISSITQPQVKTPLVSTPVIPRENGKPKASFDFKNIGKTAPKVEENKVEEKNGHSPVIDKPLDLSEIKKVWSEFGEMRKNQLAEYHLLKRDFILQENKIIISLGNPIEEPILQGIRTSLIAYLRDKLGNSSLLVVGVLELIEKSRAIYTNKEKFDHLAETNPLLKDLQERFGLDPDF